ncbi:phospholipase D-like domain-containing protein [Deinococcus budaensis]|uniref:Phosphatidylserine/phosphatidylglycerophosphate/ cardiolipin synthase-like enzyme n=1 Tax=Deinococcus budaensis TaxID=1665626 RepID=A0A7W8GCB2_9DEIO|nr:phospholipase D-like domain-containing protein [Deinococcus budaensis]MBB5232814.1 phosphatidylserine/phosphatidylglycerophosphate/cardiolipin synthase-like enzyme [Deinococcus budaensis]
MRLLPRHDPLSQGWRLALAALAGLLLGALLARGAVSVVLALVPPGQPYVRTLVGGLSALISVTLGFGLAGGLSARALPLARLGLTRGQARLRAGAAAGATAGLLVVPVGGLMGLAGIYQGGLLGDALGGTQLVGLVTAACALYGLVSGGVLGLLTVRAGLAWRPALGGLLGFGAAGLLGGSLLAWRGVPDLLSGGGWALLLVLAVFFVTLQVVGDLLISGGIAAAAEHPERDAADDRQVKLTLAALGLALLGGWGLAERAVAFVQSRPAPSAPLAVPLAAGVDCAAPTDPLELAVWRVTTRGGRPDLSCGNAYLGMLHTPNPDPAFSAAAPTPHGAYDRLAAQIAGARREVLYAVMEWADEPGRGPGAVIAGGVAALYRRVQADPAAYPDGVTVRLALGNFPVTATLEWGPQVYAATRDLLAAGVPLQDERLGWRVEVANYAGSFPHSHAKLLVTDGVDLTVTGFNVGPLHLPSGPTGGYGGDLRDLGLRLRGPVARDGLNVFDDLWARSRVLACAPGVTPRSVRAACQTGGLGVPEHPQGTDRQPLTRAGDVRAFSLYRREGFSAADEALVAALDAAQGSIELLHVSFSMNVRCNLALLNPRLCTEGDALPWMRALVRAAARGVQIRVILHEHSLLGLENRIGLASLRRELAARGLSGRFEARWSPGPLHAKAGLIDRRLLTVGSQNLHYSSWTPRGLNEYTVATTAPAAAAEYARLFGWLWEQAPPAELPGWLLGGGE